MAVVTGDIKKRKSMFGLITLCCVLLASVFVVIFFSNNNINMSLSMFSNGEKYRAEAFVKKRQGLLKATVVGDLPTAGIAPGTRLRASVDFDVSDKKVKLLVKDENNKPVSRIMVIGSVVQVGKAGTAREFKMQEYKSGDFRSAPLDLTKGGWVLTVSAYDLYTREKEKLLFYTERVIFLGEK